MIRGQIRQELPTNHCHRAGPVTGLAAAATLDNKQLWPGTWSRVKRRALPTRFSSAATIGKSMVPVHSVA